MKKTLVCVPTMDQVPAQFAQSLACLQKVGQVAVAFQISSLIYTARNELAKKAIEMEADYVLWLDSDMVFAPDILKRLLEVDRDIVTGVYYRRAAPYTPVLFDQLDIDENGCTFHNMDQVPDTLTEIAGCGFGCVLMKTQALFDVACIYQDMFSPIIGVGEDLSFCHRARSIGYHIYVEPSIKCGHVGHQIITEEFFKNYKGALDAKRTAD